MKETDFNKLLILKTGRAYICHKATEDEYSTDRSGNHLLLRTKCDLELTVDTIGHCNTLCNLCEHEVWSITQNPEFFVRDTQNKKAFVGIEWDAKCPICFPKKKEKAEND